MTDDTIFPMSTGESCKSTENYLPVDDDEGLPLTGGEAVFAIAIVLISFISACAIVKFGAMFL